MPDGVSVVQNTSAGPSLNSSGAQSPAAVRTVSENTRRFSRSSDANVRSRSQHSNGILEKISDFFNSSPEKYSQWRLDRKTTSLRKSETESTDKVLAGLTSRNFKKVCQGFRQLHAVDCKRRDIGINDENGSVADKVKEAIENLTLEDPSINKLDKFIQNDWRIDTLVDNHSDRKTLFYRMLEGLVRAKLMPSSFIEERNRTIDAQGNEIKTSWNQLRDELKQDRFRILEDAAVSAIDVKAMRKLGQCYFIGDGVEKNPEAATNVWMRAADLEGTDAMTKEGQRYFIGDGRAKDPEKAVSCWEQAAAAGSTRAMRKLGECHAGGDGVELNPEKAAEWLKKAEKAEKTDEMTKEGRRHLRGEGVRRHREIVELIKQAAKDGNIDARNQEDAGNQEIAAELFKQAAKDGNTDAMVELATCYDNGFGVRQDAFAAAGWWEKAAAAGNADAMYSLSDCYAHGDGKFFRNQAKAAKWLEKAAEAGHTLSMTKLGGRYFRDDRVENNLAKAAGWWEMAALNSNTDAMTKLGYCYSRGHGVEWNPEKAAAWWRAAAKRGNTDAMAELATCYSRGHGVERNPKKAAEWWEKAARHGNADAMRKLSDCYLFGDGVERNPEKAKEWRARAAEADIGYAGAEDPDRTGEPAYL